VTVEVFDVVDDLAVIVVVAVGVSALVVTVVVFDVVDVLAVIVVVAV
jgi:hypothetical protein